MQKKLGVTVSVSEIERVVDYNDFEKLSHIIKHGLQRFLWIPERSSMDTSVTFHDYVDTKLLGLTDSPLNFIETYGLYM